MFVITIDHQVHMHACALENMHACCMCMLHVAMQMFPSNERPINADAHEHDMHMHMQHVHAHAHAHVHVHVRTDACGLYVHCMYTRSATRRGSTPRVHRMYRRSATGAVCVWATGCSR